MPNVCHSTLKDYGPPNLTALASEEDRKKFLEITRIKIVYIETLRDPKEEQ